MSSKKTSKTKTKSKKTKTPKSLTSELNYLPEPEVIGVLDTPTQTFAQYQSSSKFFVPTNDDSTIIIGSSSSSADADHLNELLLDTIRDSMIMSHPMLVSSEMPSSASPTVMSMPFATHPHSKRTGSVAMWIFISIAMILFLFLLAGIIYACVMNAMENEKNEKEFDIFVLSPNQKQKKKVSFAEPMAKRKQKKQNGLYECPNDVLKSIQDKTFQDDMVLLFVADFCHFCKDLKPIAQEVAMDPDVVDICTITQEKSGSLGQELSKMFNVRGFPTIIRLDGTTPSKTATVFQNARTKEAIKEFAKI